MISDENETLRYYDENAEEYAQKTSNTGRMGERFRPKDLDRPSPPKLSLESRTKEKNMSEWVNLGDVDYRSYGGYLARIPDGEDDGVEGEVELIQVDPEIRDSQDRILAVMMRFDTRELSDDDIYDAMYAAGCEDLFETEDRRELVFKIGRMALAKEAASTLGDNRFAMSNANGLDFFDSDLMYMEKGEIGSWLDEVGAGGFWE